MESLLGVASLTPLPGGWSGQTFLAETAGERQVVRIYPPGSGGARGERAPEVDAALLRLVRGLLPVAEVVEVRPTRAVTDEPGLLVTTYLQGERGDLVLARLDERGAERMGRSVGDVAGRLGGMPVLDAGPFVDGDLRVGTFDGPSHEAADLPAWVAAHRPALGHWEQRDLEALTEVAADAQDLLDTVDRRCLVHGDLNPKNLLLDPATLEVTGVLDWEFAHAGHPATDLGNLLRLDRAPAYVGGVLAGYTARLGGDPERLLRLARAADLWALVELAGRREANPVASRAHDLLLGVARASDAGWTPPSAQA